MVPWYISIRVKQPPPGKCCQEYGVRELFYVITLIRKPNLILYVTMTTKGICKYPVVMTTPHTVLQRSKTVTYVLSEQCSEHERIMAD